MSDAVSSIGNDFGKFFRGASNVFYGAGDTMTTFGNSIRNDLAATDALRYCCNFGWGWGCGYPWFAPVPVFPINNFALLSTLNPIAANYYTMPASAPQVYNIGVPNNNLFPVFNPDTNIPWNVPNMFPNIQIQQTQTQTQPNNAPQVYNVGTPNQLLFGINNPDANCAFNGNNGFVMSMPQIQQQQLPSKLQSQSQQTAQTKVVGQPQAPAAATPTSTPTATDAAKTAATPTAIPTAPAGDTKKQSAADPLWQNPLTSNWVMSVKTVDPVTGEDTTPIWYDDIIAKIERKEDISDSEKALKDGFEKMHWEYSPYQLDMYRNQVLNSKGQPKLSPFGKEIQNLLNKMADKNRKGIEDYINNLAKNPDKLAALEFHFNKLSKTDARFKEITEGETLREMIRSVSTYWWVPDWTHINTDRLERIYNTLDKAAIATKNPQIIASSLHQSTKHFGLWDIRIDEDRIVNVLNKTEYNPELIAAIKEEYERLCGDGSTLETELEHTWWKYDDTDEVYEKISSM